MKLSTFFLLLVLAGVAVFAALNWQILLATTTLSLGVTEVQAPLGLVMLGLLAFVTMLFLLYLAFLQGSVLIEARRHARELQAHRGLADQAEASRFTELRRFIEAQLHSVAERDEQSRAELLERIDHLEREVRLALEQSDNSLAAHIGELEDKVDRGRGDGSPIRLP